MKPRRKKTMDYEAAMDQKYDEGKVEGKVEVATVLLAKGLDINLISEATGLTIQQINELKK